MKKVLARALKSDVAVSECDGRTLRGLMKRKYGRIVGKKDPKFKISAAGKKALASA